MDFQNLAVSKELHGKIKKIASHQGKKISPLCDQLFSPIVDKLVREIDRSNNTKEPHGRRQTRPTTS